MAFKLRSGNRPAFKNMGSSPAMQKNNKEKKFVSPEEFYSKEYQEKVVPHSGGYTQKEIDAMTEAEKIAKIDGYTPKKDREKSKELGKKEKNFNFKRPKAPGKQKMTLEERRAKHIADNKFRTDAAVDQHKEDMRKKQLKAYKKRGSVFVDAKTGKTIGKQKAKPEVPKVTKLTSQSIKARPVYTGYLQVRHKPVGESRPIEVMQTPTTEIQRLGGMTTPRTKVKKKKKIISKVKKFFKTKKK